MGKVSKRATRATRRRDWFRRPNVAFYVAWYQTPDLRGEARRQCWESLLTQTPEADEAQAEWLSWSGAEARAFILYARREAGTFALIRHYNEIETLLTNYGGTVLVVTVPADPPGEGPDVAARAAGE